MNFQQGAMGPPDQIGTLLRFWTQMEKLHYPMAGDMRRSLEDELERQQAAQQQAQQMPQEQVGGMDGSTAAPDMTAAMTEGGGMA